MGVLVAARELRKRLGDGHRVGVVDREAHHLFHSSLPWLMTGDREVVRIGRPLDRLDGHGVEFVPGEIEEIDPENPSVRVDGERIPGAAFLVVEGRKRRTGRPTGPDEASHIRPSAPGSAE